MRVFYLLAATMLLGSSLAYSQPGPVFAAAPSSLSFVLSGGVSPAAQNVVLTAVPASTAYTITYTEQSGGGWIHVNPLTGSTPATLIVQLDPFSASLTPGLYKGTITVNQTFNIPITLTVTTALVPSANSLTFSSQQGSVAPSVQTVNVTNSGGGNVPFSAVASSAGNWLSVTQAAANTPSNLTVGVNPTGLAQGSYMGTISLTSAAAPTTTIGVTLAVLPPLMYTFAPAALNFQSTSAVPLPGGQSVSVFSNIPAAFVASVATTSGGNWLNINTTSGQTPAPINVTVNPAGLNPGTYSGQINVAPTKGAAGNPIPVTLVVAAPQSPTLQVSPDTISFSPSQGGLPMQQALAVSNTGGGTLSYSAQVTAQSGGTWLTLQSNSGTATAGAPGSIPFTVTPGTLTQGTYNGTITVTANGQTASTLVILAINAQGPSLLLSQTGLVFSAAAQAVNPPSQTVYVVNAGSGTLNWNATASTLAGGNWLSVTPTSGPTQPSPLAASVVTVSVNSQNLTAGTYYGSVKVNSQVISVQTTVLPAGMQPSPSVSSNGLVLTGVMGPPNASATVVTIFNALPFTLTSATDDGANWLTVTPAAASISIVNGSTSLTAGIRHGTIRLGFSDGSTQTINVVSVVAPTGTSVSAVRPEDFFPAATGCPSVLVPQVTTLASNFTASASQSTPLSVTVVDDCGHALANSTSSSVIASFYDATKPPGPAAKLQPDQRLTPQGNGVWTGTWTPQASTAQMQVIVVALGINGTTPIAGQSTLTGTVRGAGAGSPALPLGIFNAASYQPGNTVSLGSFVSIFGTNMADGSGAPGTQPLPVSYQGTQVFLGGVALPLQYAGPNQINALIPANVAVDTLQPLVVQRDLTQAAPTAVTIADAQPGIYTANQQGTGQGAVLTSDNALDAPTGAYSGSHPATRGDYIQVFCTGLGAVSNPPAAGAAAPNSPLSRTVATVGATIGGVNAPVIFAGLAPGFIGLYQVNVTVPLGAPVGGAVPLILLVGSAVSNAATIAVQ